MDELPEGVVLPRAEEFGLRPSASVMISRTAGGGHEILLGHRVSELPSFPDLWSFPGGGVSRVDRRAAKENPEWFGDRGDDRVSTFALLREMVEEVGISPDGCGGFLEVDSETREMVCSDKTGWLEAMKSGLLSVEGFQCQVITERVTPPQSPMRFHNLFFHVPIGDSVANPSFPPGRSEFDEFRWWNPDDLISSWEGNELRLPAPIVTILRDLIEGIEEQGGLLSACDSLASDPPSGTHRYEYGPGVECVLIPTITLPPATHTNCYVLGERGGHRVIIDPAIRDKPGYEILSQKVREIEDDGSSIIATIFTHRHQDHLGDQQMISEIYDAPVWASEETLSAIGDVSVGRVLVDGDLVTLSGPSGNVNWEIIETPGHCPGQICLVGEAGVVSADNCTSVGTILVPSIDGDMGAYISGLERIREMKPIVLFPGHGPFVPNPERLLSQYIEHRKGRHRKVLEAIKSGARTLSEIAIIAYEDSPDSHKGLARDQTLSHLQELVRCGDVLNDKGSYFLE
ncbi:MAG TPA: MBL fold metallo-hydrolase [Candidatus Thalassarchaeaceae archaeon]|jgi:glyoxylase-like metal-dependent hydrolase (beta-lactamase superfamily II)/8-oxo-dGTP pyrophosphatase MutT (NUDIX family)|nr:MBL fold metallo-hydrolase [Candidatus Thalassarchaeaceae archaeon]|tara:strand:- start:787 stop:2331 length:1545 start_codon:yes stop_codon:yes gene_type:complete